MANRRGRVE